MFGVDFGEVIIVLIVLIIFIRPDDLPKVLRSAGRFYGKAKAMYKDIIDVKDKIIKEIDEIASIEETDEETDEETKTSAPAPAVDEAASKMSGNETEKERKE